MRFPKPRWPVPVGLGWLAPGEWSEGPVWLGQHALREVVGHLGDRDLERRVGTPMMLRLIFAAMAGAYDPAAGDGFRGLISFELTRPASGRAASWWTVEVSQDGRAVARRRRPDPDEAALRVRLPVPDLLRIAGGLLDPVEPVLAGRAKVSGDLELAVRLGEMLGAPQTR
jgi:hypothetical protein